MQINPIHLQDCLSRVADIAQHYRTTHIGSDDPYRSVELLRRSVESYKRVRVNLLQMPESAGTTIVKGMFVNRGDGTYDVVSVEGLAPDMDRFVVCKELFHVLLDDEAVRDMDLAAHVAAVMPAFSIDDHTPNRSVAAELLAEIAAMEFLLPRSERLKELEAGRSREQTARTFGVPVLFADRYMSPQYMENLDPDNVFRRVEQLRAWLNETRAQLAERSA